MRLAPVRLLVALAVVAALPACRPGSALHSRYNNFRAYYNTFYNAERSLEDGERTLEQAAVTIDRGRLVSVFPVSESAGGTTGPFQEAIDKSAELLRNRPTSKWADDALLVIGKAYFYQRNFVGAEQKFRETMTAAGLTGDRRLGDEARFWLGRTFAAGDRFDDGVATLEEGLAAEGGDRRWTSRMRLALGELYARAGRWDEAAEALRTGAPDEGDPDVAARAYVLLGQVEEYAGRFDLADEAYAEALRQRPAYELAFAAEVGRALVLGIDARETEPALAIVRAMRSDDKHYQRRAELALAEGRIRAIAGQTDAALALYRDVLYDEALAGGAVRGQAHYRLGELYRDGLRDFVRASAHLDTAATALRAPVGAVRPAHGAILDVADEARTYNVVAGAARRIAEVDSLLALGALSEDEFRERIAVLEADRRRVYDEEQRRLEAARTAQAFRGQGGGFDAGFNDGFGEGGASPGGRASATTGPGPAVPAANAGFLSHRNPASVQAGLIAFQQRWGDRPLVPRWRRGASVQAGAVGAARAVVSRELEGGFGVQGGPPPLDLSAVPRTEARRAELATELAGLRYELANAFFLSLGRVDTAAALYRQILAETPALPVAVRAQYALAEIERAAGRDDLARPLYEAVAAADSSVLGRASRVQLGLVEPEAPEVQTRTSAAYDAARQRWRQGDPLGAAAALVALGDAAPDEPDAPRAYFSAAAAAIEAFAGDTLALAGPLPDSLVSVILLTEAEQAEALPSEGIRPEPLPVPAEPVVDDEVEEDDAVDGEAAALPRDLPARPDPGVPSSDDGLLVRRLEERPATPPRPAAGPGRPAGPSLTDLSPADSASFTLRHHLAALANRYPETPFAERATALAALLPEPPPPPFDSTAVPPDSLAAPDSLVAADSLAAVVGDPVRPPSDSTASDAPVVLPADEAAPGALTADLSGLRSPDPLDPEAGGFTWRVRTVTLAEEATPMVRVLRDAGYRIAVLREAETGVFVIAMGQFGSEVEALAARPGLPAWAQIRGAVVNLGGYALAETPELELE